MSLSVAAVSTLSKLMGIGQAQPEKASDFKNSFDDAQAERRVERQAERRVERHSERSVNAESQKHRSARPAERTVAQVKPEREPERGQSPTADAESAPAPHPSKPIAPAAAVHAGEDQSGDVAEDVALELSAELLVDPSAMLPLEPRAQTAASLSILAEFTSASGPLAAASQATAAGALPSAERALLEASGGVAKVALSPLAEGVKPLAALGLIEPKGPAVALDLSFAAAAQATAAGAEIAGLVRQSQVPSPVTRIEGAVTAADIEMSSLHIDTKTDKVTATGPAGQSVAQLNPPAGPLAPNAMAEAILLDKAASASASDLKAVESRGSTSQPVLAALAARPTAEVHTKPLAVTVPVNQPNWGQAAGERILWMVSQKLQAAELQLDPPELGPLQVKISVHNDQVSLSFVSQHAQVREALDLQSLRLREMFEGQGLNLVDVDVSDQSFQQQREQSNSHGAGVGSAEEADAEPVSVTGASMQLVDQFV